MDWKKSFIVKGVSKFALSIEGWNPIHHSTIKAREAKFQDIVAPGVMVMGFISATISEMIPMAIARSLEIEFLKPLYEGLVVDVICMMKKRKISAEVKVEVYSTDKMIAKGSCILLIPQMRKKQQKNL